MFYVGKLQGSSPRHDDMGNMLLLGSILSLLTLSVYTPSAFLLVQDPTSSESTGPYEVDVELESSTHDRLSGESADQTKALLEVHDSFVFATSFVIDLYTTIMKLKQSNVYEFSSSCSS